MMVTFFALSHRMMILLIIMFFCIGFLNPRARNLPKSFGNLQKSKVNHPPSLPTCRGCGGWRGWEGTWKRWWVIHFWFLEISVDLGRFVARGFAACEQIWFAGGREGSVWGKNVWVVKISAVSAQWKPSRGNFRPYWTDVHLNSWIWVEFFTWIRTSIFNIYDTFPEDRS